MLHNFCIVIMHPCWIKVLFSNLKNTWTQTLNICKVKQKKIMLTLLNGSEMLLKIYTYCFMAFMYTNYYLSVEYVYIKVS